MNVLHATTGIAYALGMALVFGGTAALSFAAAPATFRTLRPADAGRVFGKTLRTFDAMGFAAALVALAAAAVDLVAATSPGAVVRAVLAVTVAALLQLVRRALAPRMAALKPPETEEEDRTWDPERRAAFNRLHAQYVRIYAANLFLSLGALSVQALAR